MTNPDPHRDGITADRSVVRTAVSRRHADAWGLSIEKGKPQPKKPGLWANLRGFGGWGVTQVRIDGRFGFRLRR